MIGKITTKEELLNVREENGRKLIKLENQLTLLKKEVDYLGELPKNRIIRVSQSVDITKLKIPKKWNVISIPEIKKRINNFFREYGLVKTDVNHTYSARTTFSLTPEEDEQLRDQKRKSDDFQTVINKINNALNDFLESFDDRYLYVLPDGTLRICSRSAGGEMTQLDLPNDGLITSESAEQPIESVLEDLEENLVIC